MNVSDMFLQMVLRGLWMGGEVLTTLTFGMFSTPFFVENQAELAIVLEQFLDNQLDPAYSFNFITPWLALGDPTRLTLLEASVYGKYDQGQTQVRKKSLTLSGTRTVGSTALPPQTTIRTYAASQVYGEKGSSIGLPGVYEGDAADGYVSSTSDAVIAAEAFCDRINAGFVFEATETYQFWPCTVKRIRYNTPSGKIGTRMPFEPGDAPSVYRLGDRSVQYVSGTNNHRKIGTGS